MWHTREPHILLFRRLTVQQQQSHKSTIAIAGSAPAATAAAAATAVQAAAAPVRSAPATMTDTTTIATAPAPQTAPAAVAKAVPTAATAVEHQSGSPRRPRLRSKSQGNVLGDGLTPPCKQVVPGALGCRHHDQANQDETVAAAGLSPKLFSRIGGGH